MGYYKSAKKYARKAATVADTATKALRVANSVAAMLNVETKHFDRIEAAGGVAFAIDNDGDFYNLAEPIIKGLNTVANRVGDSIKLTHLRILGSVEYDAALGGQQNVRVLLINKPAATVLTVDAMLEQAGTAAATLSQFDWTNNQYFKVLWDRRFAMYNDKEIHNFKIDRKMNLHVKWKTIANDVVKNQLLLLFISDTDPAAPNFPGAKFVSRVEYVDN